jgi:hypothetical protein
MQNTQEISELIIIQVLLVMVIVINMYTGTLTLREEHRLMAFENGALRKGRRGRK